MMTMTHQHRHATPCPVSRRTLLKSLGIIGLTAVAGCLGDDEDIDYEPISLTDGQTCAVCGMEIAGHFGPAVQAYYDGEDEPVGFDSLFEFIEYDAQQLATGGERSAAFATDYSRVTYEVTDVDGELYISTHAEVSDFTELELLEFVIDTPVKGAMGYDAIPFGDKEDAQSFAFDHDGSTVDWNSLVDTRR